MCLDIGDLFSSPRLPDPEPLPEVEDEPIGMDIDEIARRRAARDAARVSRNDLVRNPATRTPSGTGLSLGDQ